MSRSSLPLFVLLPSLALCLGAELTVAHSLRARRRLVRAVARVPGLRRIAA